MTYRRLVRRRRSVCGAGVNANAHVAYGSDLVDAVNFAADHL